MKLCSGKTRCIADMSRTSPFLFYKVVSLLQQNEIKLKAEILLPIQWQTATVI